ncbi:enolase 4 [Megalops cyprinoides]|uniref:enolase 4 n=1 Tax=Megalops cyprinoides TaxID=118141 RepID=UPI0018652D38|nr:enolase 4 [Megalops cyprinoides]
MSYRGFFNSNSRVSKQDQEFYDLKNRAVEYYRANGVPQKMECVLNEMFFEKPDDVYGYLANYFSRLSAPPVISRILGKEVYDGKGQLTIQAEIFCTIKNEEKSVCSAVISSHCEARDGSVQDPGTINESDKRKDSVTTALRWINEPLSTLLKGFEPRDQTGVDKVLRDFFMARFLEDQERQSQEKANQQASDPVPAPTPPNVASKDKKGGEKGKKSNNAEKPVPPPEPPVPVLPGCMAFGSVSMAVAKAAAQLEGIPLYQHVTALTQKQFTKEIHIPLPMVTLLSCGKMSPGKLNLMEEVIVIPKAGQSVRQFVTKVLELQREITRMVNAAAKTGPAVNAVSDCGALVIGYDRPEQPLDLVTEASNNLGFVLGDEMYLAINCAAHDLMDYQKGKYDVITGASKSPDELVDMYEVLTSKYPALIALIDPLRKEDQEQWQKLSSMLGQSYLLSEDSSKPVSPHSNEGMLPPPGIKGFILKQTNQTTVTDLIEITQQLEDAVTIIGTTSGETCDDSLADLAVGLGVKFVKLGGLCRGERLTKYNRLISIEEELAQQGILAGL